MGGHLCQFQYRKENSSITAMAGRRVACLDKKLYKPVQICDTVHFSMYLVFML